MELEMVQPGTTVKWQDDKVYHVESFVDVYCQWTGKKRPPSSPVWEYVCCLRNESDIIFCSRVKSCMTRFKVDLNQRTGKQFDTSNIIKHFKKRHPELYVKMMSNNSRSSLSKKTRLDGSASMDGGPFLGQKIDGLAALQDNRAVTPSKARDNLSVKRRRQSQPKAYGTGTARGFEGGAPARLTGPRLESLRRKYIDSYALLCAMEGLPLDTIQGDGFGNFVSSFAPPEAELRNVKPSANHIQDIILKESKEVKKRLGTILCGQGAQHVHLEIHKWKPNTSTLFIVVVLSIIPDEDKMERSRLTLGVLHLEEGYDQDTVAQQFQALSEHFQLHVYCEIMGCTASFTDPNLWSAFNRLRGEPFVNFCHDKQFNAAVKHTLGLMNGGASYDNLGCRELLVRSARMIRHLNVSQTVKEKLPEAQEVLEEFLKHAEPILGISPSQDVDIQNSDLHPFLVPTQSNENTSNEESKATSWMVAFNMLTSLLKLYEPLEAMMSSENGNSAGALKNEIFLSWGEWTQLRQIHSILVLVKGTDEKLKNSHSAFLSRSHRLMLLLQHQLKHIAKYSNLLVLSEMGHYPQCKLGNDRFDPLACNVLENLLNRLEAAKLTKIENKATLICAYLDPWFPWLLLDAKVQNELYDEARSAVNDLLVSTSPNPLDDKDSDLNSHKFSDGGHVSRQDCSSDDNRVSMMFLEAFTHDVPGAHDTMTESVSRNDEILKAYEECIWRDARIAIPGKTWNQLRTLEVHTFRHHFGSPALRQMEALPLPCDPEPMDILNFWKQFPQYYNMHAEGFCQLRNIASMYFSIDPTTCFWENTSAPRSTSPGWGSFCNDLIDACVVLRGNKTLVSNYAVDSEGYH